VQVVGTVEFSNFVAINAENILLTVLGVRDEFNSFFWTFLNIRLFFVFIIIIVVVIVIIVSVWTC
jgi:hypothetical protein